MLTMNLDSADDNELEKEKHSQKSAKQGINAYTIALVAIVESIATYLKVFGNIKDIMHANLWLIIPLTLVPIIIILPNIISQIEKLKRKFRLKEAGKTDHLRDPEYFRTYPYEEIPEYMTSFRADKAHEKVLQWIIKSKEPILFLSGKSGTGKTSILQAYVCPELEKQDPSYKIIMVRSFDDPIEELREEIVKLGIVDHNADDDVRVLIEKTLKKLSPDKLLIIFDQFEELMIVHEHDPERVMQTSDLLASFSTNPVPGLKILLSFRNDCLPLLEAFNLPAISNERNWFLVNAFTEQHAADFLINSNLGFSKESLDALFEQIATFEETRGIVRPIILNMVGLILTKSEKLNIDFKRKRAKDILSNYLRFNIYQREMKDHAPQILDFMITDYGTKEPRSINEINIATGLSKAEIRGTMSILANSGLVRMIDRKDEIWEVSHDFIAHQLLFVLRGKRQSVREVMSPYIAPAALVLWAINIFFLLPSSIANFKQLKTIEAINVAGGSVTKNDDGTKSVTFNFQDNNNLLDSAKLKRAIFLIHNVKNLRDLEISYCSIEDDELSFLKDFKTLSRLDLSGNNITDKGLVHISELTNLKRLWLDQNHITNSGLQYLKNLNNLTSLNLQMNQLTDEGFSNLNHMKNLNNLYLGGNINIRDDGFKYLSDMKSLKTLFLWRTQISDSGLAILGSMKSLETLSLSSTRITDEGLSYLSGLSSLQVLILEDVGISDNGLSYLKNLRNLKYLILPGNQIDDDGLAYLKELTSLETLTLDDNNLTGSGLESIANLKSISELYLANNNLKQEFLSYLSGLNLESLDLQNNKIDGAGLVYLQNIKSLKTLNISGNNINDKDLANLTGLSLEKLNLSVLDLTNNSFEYLNKIKTLKYLDLSNTKINEKGLEKLGGLTSLENLYIYGIKIPEDTYIFLKQKNQKLKIYPEKW